jgi:hypothetical protein
MDDWVFRTEGHPMRAASQFVPKAPQDRGLITSHSRDGICEYKFFAIPTSVVLLSSK